MQLGSGNQNAFDMFLRFTNVVPIMKYSVTSMLGTTLSVLLKRSENHVRVTRPCRQSPSCIPEIFQLEDRCLLSIGGAVLENLLTPASMTPVGNMVAGTKGDL